MNCTLWMNSMKLSGGSQERTQERNKREKVTNFHLGFSISPVDLPGKAVFLHRLMRFFLKIDPGAFLAIPEAFMGKIVYFPTVLEDRGFWGHFRSILRQGRIVLLGVLRVFVGVQIYQVLPRPNPSYLIAYGYSSM